MQEKIRGWRHAAERKHGKRGARDAQLSASARLMGTALMLAWRALSAKRAAQARQGIVPRHGSTPRRTMMPRRAAGPGWMIVLRRPAGSGRMIMPRRAVRSGRPMMPRRVSGSMRDISRMGRGDLTRVVGGAGLLAAGVGFAGWMAARPTESRRDRAMKNRWMMVTINCSPARLASPADLPEPIIRLGDAVDIKICQAPGDRGTELGARLRDFPRGRMGGTMSWRAGSSTRRAVQQALRQAKSLIEAEEVLRTDGAPSPKAATTENLLEFAGRRGGRR